MKLKMDLKGFWMSDLVFALNVVMPLFIIMAAGYALRVTKIIPITFVPVCNKLIFKFLLPLYLFYSISRVDLSQSFDVKLVGTGAVSVLIVIGLCFIFVPMIIKDNNRRGVIIQAIFRSNFILYGLPVAQRISGDLGAAMTSMLIAVIIPIFNFFAVFTLAIFENKANSAENKKNKLDIKAVLLDIAKNPLIFASLTGLVFSGLKIELPDIIQSPIADLAKIATPLALLMLGIQFEIKKISANKFALAVGTVGRLIVVPSLVLSVAAFMSFSPEAITALIALTASPVAVTSYIMAVNAGADDELAGQLVVTTTLLSVVTLFMFVYIFRSFGLI